jgi:predicted RNase H-like HicB family nuclease
MRKTEKMLRYTVIFEEAPEGGYTVHVPALGCVTEGETFEEASAMARDAIQCYVASLIKHGEPVPKEGRTEIVASLAVPIPAMR